MLKEILTTPAERLGSGARFLVFQIRLWPQCVKLLKKNEADRQAAALSYYSIFGVVPLAIVMLMIFQSFPAYEGIADKVKGYAYEYAQLSNIEYPDAANPGKSIKVTEHLDKFVEKFFTESGKGSVTIVSVVMIIYAALSLLTTIENTFNSMWHIARGRSFVSRMINYWALLTLGPLLLGLGIYVGSQYGGGAVVRVSSIFAGVKPVLVYLISAAIFFFLYLLMPNTKVDAKAAMLGAAIAAVAWMAAKWGFKVYITKFIPYSEMYGLIGLIPLTVFWIYVMWLIILFGLQLAFTMQNLKTLEAAEAATKKTEQYFIANDITAVNIMRVVCGDFQAHKAPPSTENICGRLDMPGEFGEKILNHLINCGLVLRVTEPSAGFAPATNPEKITVAEVTEAVAKGSFAQKTQKEADGLEGVANEQRQNLSRYNLSQFIGGNSP